MNSYRLLLVVGGILLQLSSGYAQVSNRGIHLPPIFEAAREGDAVRFQELLKKDSSPINKTLAQVDRREYKDSKYQGYTLLHFAAENGSSKIIQQLLDLEVDVAPHGHQAGPIVKSPLELAAMNGHLEAVKLLLKAKADPDRGWVAAAENGHTEVLKAFIEGGADVNVPAAWECLRRPAEKGYAEVVEIILKEQAKDKENFRIDAEAFNAAAATGHLDVVKIFVTYGAKVNKEVIRKAIEGNQAEVIAYLKKAQKTQEAAAAENETTKAKQETIREEEKTAKEAVESAAIKKRVLTDLVHPKDVFGLAESRYRKFNGKDYDCVEPIEFLNRFFSFKTLVDQFADRVDSETKGKLQEEAQWLQANPWDKAKNECSLLPLLVKQVTAEGLIVQLNSQVGDEVLVLLRNHPKQGTFVDGDVIIGWMFAIKIRPYSYTGVLGIIRTIPSYDFGAVIPTPAGSVEKIPLPSASH